MENFNVEQLDEILIHLENGFEMNQHNDGVSSGYWRFTHLMQDILFQIESLRKENASLLAEFRYLTEEKSEQRKENSALQNQIRRLENELKGMMMQSLAGHT